MMRTLLKHAMLGVAASLMLCGSAFAQTSGAPTFGPESYPFASEAQTLQGQNEHKKAIRALKKGLKLDGLSAYEVSTMYQMMGASHYARGKNEDTIEAFQNAINAGGLSQKDTRDLQANLAQLNIAEKNFALGAQQLEAYFNAGGPQRPTLIKTLVKAHLQAKNREAAVPWAEAMERQGLIKTRKDHELVIYLFDSPEKRATQMRVARQLYSQFPTDPAVITQIKRLNVKAKRDGVPVIAIAGG
jgi:hypothetical protein